MKKFCVLVWMLCLWVYFPIAQSATRGWQQQIRAMVKKGTVLAVDEKGEVLFSLNPNLRLVPASTLKVATSLAALHLFGEDYRFKTDFYTNSEGHLYIKGYGDPFLVSEELAVIAQELKAKGLTQVKDIILDHSFFDPNIQIHGLVGSLNPYDAYNGALLANFNTIYVIKDRKGQVRSAEPQTPITEISRRLARKAPVGKSRINVAMHRQDASLYVGYLLREFLTQQGVNVMGQVVNGRLDPKAKLFLSHQNSKKLSGVLKAALKYSQNLINNQIFLVMGALQEGAPATVEKGKKVFHHFLKNQVGLTNFNVEEGSGISRKNYITALEMDKILVRFFPYHQLLPEKNGVWAKTGTLRGVSGLVGYFKSPSRGWVRFVIILNQPSNYRDKIVRLLKANL